MKQPHFQHLILKAVRLLELLLAAAIVLIIIYGAVYLLGTTVQSLLSDPGSFSVSAFLSHALLLVMIRPDWAGVCKDAGAAHCRFRDRRAALHHRPPDDRQPCRFSGDAAGHRGRGRALCRAEVLPS